MQAFILALLVKASQDKNIQDFVDARLALLFDRLKAELGADIQTELDKLKDELLAQLVGMLPAFGTSIIKTAFDHLPQVANLPAAENLASDLAQNILDISHTLPGVGPLEDILKGFLR